MKVTLEKSEISEAVVCYLNQQGLDVSKDSVQIRIITARSSEDTRIEIELNSSEAGADNSEEIQVEEQDAEVKTPVDPFNT